MLLRKQGIDDSLDISGGKKLCNHLTFFQIIKFYNFTFINSVSKLNCNHVYACVCVFLATVAYNLRCQMVL